MKITGNVDANVQALVTAADVKQAETKAKENEKIDDKAAELSLSKSNIRQTVVTDEELQVALENVMASESSVMDVEAADEMIREAMKSILSQSDDAVLSQANQTKQVVAELSK